MVDEETYRAAEKSLIDWVDLCTKHKLSMPDIVFLLQFRIFDINTAARAHYFESQKSLEEKEDNDQPNRTI